ncbi:MAG: DUF1501 domain-containing protein [Deltaproteobacteria bacterium]|nr:DUF1501 domain-containing protein [Deltaproteobacteria bacterium]
MRNVSLARRKFLRHAAACSCGALAMGAIPGLANRPAHAATGNGTKLLLINMAGGWDGLQICQPSSGALYTTFAGMRPTLKTDPAQLLDINGAFGFHPSLSAFKSLLDEGKLVSVLNVGYLNMSRSHKDAEVAFARGILDRESVQASGMISRMGEVNGWSSLQALSLNGIDPAFEGASYRGIQVYGISNFRYGYDYTQNYAETLDRVATARQVSDLWQIDPAKPKQAEVVSSVNVAVDSSELLYQARENTTFPTAYPNTQLGRSLRDADILFSNSSLGTEVAYIKRGGFDTHSEQTDSFDRLLPEFNAALTTFISNMKAKNIWSNLIILVISEFGRTNQENDSQGTDHGGALPIFVLGGPVNGFGNSGLIGAMTTTDLTDDGWLPMKINMVDIYRQVFARMGYNPDAAFEPAAGSEVSLLFS